MKVSGLTEKEIMNLPDSLIEHIVFDNINVEESAYDYGIVLGGKPVACGPRGEKAAGLYRRGRVKKLIATGGVMHETENGLLSECEIIRNVLLKNGVPDEDILIDNLARSTTENMQYASVLMLRDCAPSLPRSAVIITSYSHLKRSLALAERLLPEYLKTGGAYAENTDDFPGRWQGNESKRARVMREILTYPETIKKGMMDDIEFD